MDAAFAQAAEPRPHKVLGLILPPLTLGHLHLLFEIQSPFVTNGDPTIWDLINAVFICRLPQDKVRRVLRSWWVPLFLRLWRWETRKLNPFQEYENFREFINANFTRPAGNEPKFREEKVPSHWHALVALMRDLHMSKAEAMNTPLIEVNCLIATIGDFDGTIDLQSERQRELWKFAAEQDRIKFGGN